MPHVMLRFLLPNADADRVFAQISDFPRYADHTDAVREIRIDHRAGDQVTSTWTVNFRNGILCWTERDRIDPVALEIEFDQVKGDFAEFTGTWRVDRREPDVGISFAADFDLGMPSLAAIINPIAEDALRQNIQSIVRGLLGESLLVVDDDADVVGARSA